MKKGIYPGLGMSDYHGWKLDKTDLAAGPISCSMLKDFRKNPFAWAKTSARKSTASLRTGSLFDAVLTDADWQDQIVEPEYDSYRTNVAKAWKAEMEAEGKLIVKPEDLAHAVAGADAVRNHKVAGAILEGAEFQVGVVGEVAGIPAKCLIDILPSKDGDYAETIVDYKTTANGLSDDDLARTIGKWGYHLQASFYRSLFNQVSDDRHCEEFIFIFQDTATLEVRVIYLDSVDLVRGNSMIASAVAEFKDAAENGIRSRYADGIDPISLPDWQAGVEDGELEKRGM